jgi:hypothetical protein
VQVESGVITPASSSSNGAAQMAPMGLPESAKVRMRSMISVRLRSLKTAGPPGRTSKSNARGSGILESRVSVHRVIFDRPVTSISSEQEATSTSSLPCGGDRSEWWLLFPQSHGQVKQGQLRACEGASFRKIYLYLF